MQGDQGRRRTVFNDVRREIERQGMVALAAAELAEAVSAFLQAGEDADKESLRMALARFRTATRT